MPYVVVNRENAVLSRASPDALLSWIDAGVARATDYRYAVLFETSSGARKCAGIYGGDIELVETPPEVGRSRDPAGGVGDCGGDRVVAVGG